MKDMALGKDSVEREIGGRTLKIETGKLGRQAAGTVIVTYGDTIVLAAAVTGNFMLQRG